MYRKRRRSEPKSYSRKRSRTYKPWTIDPAFRAQHIAAQGFAETARGSAASKAVYGETYKTATMPQRMNRLRAGFRGRGDYSGQGDYASWKPFLQKWVPKGSLSAVGGYLAGGFGSHLGQAASNYLGWGDYAGEAGGNQIIADSNVHKPITVNASNDLSGDIYISHREYLGNVTALGTGVSTPSSFSSQTFPINVGVAATFPWLSQIAVNFSLYELEGCIFEYRPTSGELGSAANTLGKVVMVTQYDPDASPFTSTIEMENYDYSNACKPSEHMIHGVETDPKQRATKMLYVRSGVSSKDKIFTDVGFFQVATEGLPVNVAAGTQVNVGELWVTYKVKLSRANLFSALSKEILTDFFLARTTGAVNLFNDSLALQQSTTYLLNSYSTPADVSHPSNKKTNGIGCDLSTGGLAGFNITFPVTIVNGTFKVFAYIQNGAAAATGWSAPVLTNCKLLSNPTLSSGAASSQVAPEGAIVATTKSIWFYVQINAPGFSQASIAMNLTANAAANCVTAVEITEFNPTAI